MSFFKTLEPIVSDTLYIGADKHDLDNEIHHNMWMISASEEDRLTLSVDGFEQFFSDVIDNRRKQVQESTSEHGMLFYLWFDMQASQLRFCLISDFHDTLPFGAKTNLIDRPRPIIEEFLLAKSIISFDELEIEDFTGTQSVEEPQQFILDVYLIKIGNWNELHP